MKRFKFQHKDGYYDIIKATTKYWAGGYYWKINNSSDPKFWNKDLRHNLEGELDKEHKFAEKATEAAILYCLKNLI